MNKKIEYIVSSLLFTSIIVILSTSCNKNDEIVSQEIIFNPNLSYGSIKDVDNNEYKTITIGTQTWMAENLKTTSYQNGEPILTTDSVYRDITKETIQNYQWAFNGDENKAKIYGRLYSWYTITDKRMVCPSGWHIPSDEEWNILSNYLGGEKIAGIKLKETGENHWMGNNTNSTNESGFTGIPGGFRRYDGTNTELGKDGYWWSSTSANNSLVWYRDLSFSSDSLYRGYYFGRGGFSVRCIKDE